MKQDVDLLFSSPSSVLLSKSILKGQQSTWRYLALLKNRLGIELTLADEFMKLRDQFKSAAIPKEAPLTAHI